MSYRTMTLALSSAALLLGASAAVAQPSGMRPGAGMPGQDGMQREYRGNPGERGMMDCGMGQGGMMGGRGMMGSGMMRGGMMGGRGGGHALPQLPPGNEKLQLQMQAEMMQKMGEILAKYASRIKE